MKTPGIELLKWLGVFAMLYDHAALFAGVSLPFAHHVGSFAFPAFVYAMVGAMHDKPVGKFAQVARRMFMWGLLAQIAVCFVRDPLPLNVLFTLGAGLGLSALLSEELSPPVFLSMAAFAVLGAFSEFSIPGLAFIVAAHAHVRGHSFVWPVAASIFLAVFNEFSLGASFAAVACGFLLQFGPELKRIPRVFYPLYVLQWPLMRLI